MVLSGAIDVDDLVGTVHVATNETWNDNDSELATTGRITDFIGTEIANSTVHMHTQQVQIQWLELKRKF